MCLPLDFAVLAELGFAFEAVDGDLDADDGLEHAVDVLGAGIAHLPWLGLGGFVPPRQARDDAAHEGFIVADDDAAMGVHKLVVPRRHQTSGQREALTTDECAENRVAVGAPRPLGLWAAARGLAKVNASACLHEPCSPDDLRPGLTGLV